MGFEGCDFAFIPTRLEARRTDVLPAQFYIAKGADETATQSTGNNCLFLLVKVTARLITDGKETQSLSVRRLLEKGRKYFNSQACIAGRAPCHIRSVEELPLKGYIAFGAVDRRAHHAVTPISL
jgi:hypothetical protein